MSIRSFGRRLERAEKPLRAPCKTPSERLDPVAAAERERGWIEFEQRMAVMATVNLARLLAGTEEPNPYAPGGKKDSAANQQLGAAPPPESAPVEPPRPLEWWEEEPQIPGPMPLALQWMNVPAPPANATGTIEFDRATGRWVPQRVPRDRHRWYTAEEVMKLPLTYDVPPFPYGR